MKELILSEREKQILHLLRTGMDQKDIAREVYLSTRIVKYSISSMCDRFKITSGKAIELVAYAIENNLIENKCTKGQSEGVAQF